MKQSILSLWCVLQGWLFVLLSLPMGSRAGETATVTYTLTGSASHSESPTMSRSPSATISRSPTFSVSPSASFSKSLSASRSATFSRTKEYFHNNTVTMEPYRGLQEGQEFRLKFDAHYSAFGKSYSAKRFNVSDAGSIQTMGFEYSRELDQNCSGYISAVESLFHTFSFGVSREDSGKAEWFVDTAYVTAVAPAVRFVVCYKHRVDPALVDFEYNDKWILLRDGADYVATPEKSFTFYYIPAPIVQRSNAVVKVISTETGWNFTATPSGCLFCGVSDSFKIVRKGATCTEEKQGFASPYYGSNFVNEYGEWTANGGLAELATSGGAGVFGTAFINPLVDTTDGGTILYNETNGAAREAFAYVTLPHLEGDYDVCFSSLEQRKRIYPYQNKTMPIPVWRRLRACSSASCGEDIATYTEDTSSTKVSQWSTLSMNATSFTVVPEVLSWSMPYLNPDSYGVVSVQDLEGNRTTLYGTETHEATSYWRPVGGAAMKVLPASRFPVFSGNPSITTLSCWDRGAGGDASLLEPTSDVHISYSLTQTSPHSVSMPFYVPIEQNVTYYVCLREGFRGVGSTTGGWRVVPYAGSASLAYRDSYVLRPGYYNVTIQDRAWGWKMNDTRAATWGGLTLYHSNATEISGGVWRNVRGGGVRVRLIPEGRPCDWNHVDTVISTYRGAESTLAGQAECDAQHIARLQNSSECLGELDGSAALQHTFTFHLPEESARGFAVCYKYGSENWLKDATPLYVAPRSNISLSFGERRAGVETLFTVQEHTVAHEGGSLATDSHRGRGSRGDLFRLVPLHRVGGPAVSCQINPMNYDAGLLDTYLSVVCTGSFYASSASDSCQILRTSLGLKDLISLNERTPEAYRTLVQQDVSVFGLFATGAVLTLPTANMEYQICYKQTHPARGNWLIFNETIRIEPQDPIVVVTPSERTVLIGGSLQRFEVEVPRENGIAISDFNNHALSSLAQQIVVGTQVDTGEESGVVTGFYLTPITTTTVTPVVGTNPDVEVTLYTGVVVAKALSSLTISSAETVFAYNKTVPQRISGRFMAKFVPIFPEYENHGCHDVPASTSSTPYGSYTDHATAGSTIDRIAFHLIAPQDSGKYLLCLRLTELDERSWRHGGHFSVENNGIRWEIHDIPLSSAALTITLSHCGDANCEENGKYFNISSGGDAAKVVPYTDACFAEDLLQGPSATSYTAQYTSLGTSRAVDTTLLPNGLYAEKPTTDLGEVDGNSLTATFGVTLPHYRVRTPLKICVKTKVRGSVLWVEVQESERRFSSSHRPVLPQYGLVVVPSAIERFELDKTLLASTQVGEAVQFPEVFAGTSAVSPGISLRFTDTWNATSPIEFKLVKINGNTLPTAGNGRAPQSCAHGADTLQHHPTVYNAIPIEFSVEEGRYILCLRPQGYPWLQIPGGYYDGVLKGFIGVTVLAHPVSFTASWNVLSLIDASSTGLVSSSSWCGLEADNYANGANCSGSNDRIFLANDSDLCPPPSTSGWVDISRQNNVTSGVSQISTASFLLPPLYPSSSGRYKVCLYKAGQFDHGGASVKKNVVYVIRNNGVEQSGKGSFFYETAAVLDGLDVVFDLSYNSSYHFVEYNASTQKDYAGAPLVDGSSTPVVSTGQVVSFTVRPSSGGRVVPYGNFAVWVEFCERGKAFSDLTCLTSYESTIENAEKLPFSLHNIGGGSCSAGGGGGGGGGAGFGWTNLFSTKQFLETGLVTFNLQYTSACPEGSADGTLNAGCGIVFKGLPEGVKPTLMGGEYSVISSKPYWLNVKQRDPNGVEVNEVWVQPEYINQQRNPRNTLNKQPCASVASGEASCPVFTCFHNVPCEVLIRARHDLTQERAPAGSLYLRFYDEVAVLGKNIVHKSFGISSAPLAWRNGEYLHRMTPLFSDTVTDEALICFNVTTAAGIATTSKICVHFTRKISQAIRLLEVEALDVVNPYGVMVRPWASTRTNSVADTTNYTGVGAPDYSTITAAEGAYLESLYPYRMLYSVVDSQGSLMSHADLSVPHYNISFRTANFPVLSAHGTAEDNFIPSAQYLQVFPSSYPVPAGEAELSAKGYSPTLFEKVFAVDFRVLHNRGCATVWDVVSGSTKGCDIGVQVKRENSPELVLGKLHSPIRIPATSLVVSDENKAGIPGFAHLSSGKQVRVVPGSTIEGRFYHDDFHRGEIFASYRGVAGMQAEFDDDPHDEIYLIGNTYGESHARTPDFVLNRLGVVVTLRTQKPCYNCEFLVQSTWGAQADPLTLTLADDTSQLYCATHTQNDVFWAADSNTSDPFNITITTANPTATTTPWPDWAVLLGNTTTSDLYSIIYPNALHHLRGGQLFIQNVRLIRKDGKNGVDLSKGRAQVIQARTMQETYGKGVGNAPHEVGAVVELGCGYTVQIWERVVAAPVARLVLQNVTGGEVLCDATGCGGVLMGTSVVSPTVTLKLLHENSSTPQPSLSGLSVHIYELGLNGFNTSVLLQSVHSDEVAYNSTKFSYGELNASFSTPTFITEGTAIFARFSLQIASFQRKGLVPSMLSPFSDVRLTVCIRNETSGAAIDAASCAHLRLFSVVETNAFLDHPQRYTAMSNVVGINRTAVYTSLAPGCSIPGAECGNAGVVSLSALVYFFWNGIRIVDFASTYSFDLTTTGSSVALLSTSNTTLALSQSTLHATSNISAPYNVIPGGKNIAFFSFTGLGASEVVEFTVSTKGISCGWTQDGAERLFCAAKSGFLVKYNPNTVGDLPYQQWKVQDAVVDDEECPSQREGLSFSFGYKQRRVTPGLGWEYALGNHVGVPFPIQTRLDSSTGTRSWGASTKRISITKDTSTGCNNGGTLTLFDLKAYGKVPLYDGTPSSFTKVTAGTLSSGVSTTWVSFAESCERCRLVLSLCYASTVFTKDCLVGEPDLNGPVLPMRTKITKSFTISAPQPQHILVTAQSNNVNTGKVVTGDVLTFSYIPILRYGLWAVPAAARVSIMVSIASDVTGYYTKGHWGRSGQYGGGGFVAHGVGSVRCAPTPLSSQVSSLSFFSEGSEENEVRFAFTKPCASCRVNIEAEVNGVRSLLYLRQYTGDASAVGSPTGFVVKGCVHGWAVAGYPSHSTKRRTAFAISVLPVNIFGEVLHSTSTAEYTASMNHSGGLSVAPGGNGGGGRIRSWARSVNDTMTTEPPRSFLVKFERSCYACGVSVQGIHHALTVFSPAQKAVVQNLRTTVSHGVQQILFNMYLAAEYGDRAFGVGGPSMLDLQALYSKGKVVGRRINLDATTPSVMAVAMVGGGLASIVVGHGAAVMHIQEKVWNGIPVKTDANLTKWGVGHVHVEVRGVAPAYFPLKLSVEGESHLATVDIFNHNLFTELSTQAEALAVSPQGEILARQGVTTTIEVFTVAVSNPASSPPLYVKGRYHGNITAEWVCSECPSCHTLPTSVPIVHGTASFDTVFTEYDVCGVTFSGANFTVGNATQNITANVAVQGVYQTRWMWVNSSSFSPETQGSAESLAHYPVQLALRATQNDVSNVAIWTEAAVIKWSTAPSEALFSLVNAYPLGCFVPSAVSVSQNGVRLLLTGEFIPMGGSTVNTTAASTCNVSLSKTGFFPQGEATVMIVAVRELSTALISPTQNYHAKVGVKTPIALHLIDASGTLVAGDHLTTASAFDVYGSEVAPMTQAISGVITLYIVIEAQQIHFVEYFCKVVDQAGYDLVTVKVALQVVQVADSLVVELRAGGAAEWVPFTGKVPWVIGYVFSLRFSVVDSLGNRATELPMASLPLYVRPSTAPCIAIDEGQHTTGGPLISSSCAGVYGECKVVTLPQCTPLVTSWGFASTTNEGAQGHFVTSGGVLVLEGLHYKGHASFVSPEPETPGFPVGLVVESPLLLHESVNSFLFQRIASMRTSLSEIGCTSRGRHQPLLCSLQDLGLHASFKNVTAERLISDPRSTILTALRIQPGIPFNLSVTLLDESGQPVLGDSLSHLEISAECVDARSPPFFMGAKVSGGVDDTVSGWNVGAVRFGVAVFENIAFAGWCSSVRLGIVCRNDPKIDSSNLCNSLTAQTELFEVGSTALAVSPSPIPTPYLGVNATVQIDIGPADISQIQFAKLDTALLDAILNESLTASAEGNGVSLENAFSALWVQIACRVPLQYSTIPDSIRQGNVGLCTEREPNTKNAGRSAFTQNGCSGGCNTMIEVAMVFASEAGKSVGIIEQSVGMLAIAISGGAPGLGDLGVDWALGRGIVKQTLPLRTPAPFSQSPKPTPLPPPTTPRPPPVNIVPLNSGSQLCVSWVMSVCIVLGVLS